MVIDVPVFGFKHHTGVEDMEEEGASHNLQPGHVLLLLVGKHLRPHHHLRLWEHGAADGAGPNHCVTEYLSQVAHQQIDAQSGSEDNTQQHHI